MKKVIVSMDKITLYAIAHAGASAMLYKKYQKLLESHYELVLLERPGIGLRLSEDLIHCFPGVLDDLRLRIESHQNSSRPFAIFGHSFGALLAYELSHERDNDPLFRHLFLSACSPPSRHAAKQKLSLLNNEDFLKAICEIGQTDLAEMERTEVMRFFQPILRADFQAFDSYQYVKKKPLSVKATVLYGQNDHIIDSKTVTDWDECFQEKPRYERIKGNHMFHVDEYAFVASVIQKTLISEFVC